MSKTVPHDSTNMCKLRKSYDDDDDANMVDAKASFLNNYWVYITNLNYKTVHDELYAEFKKYGAIDCIEMNVHHVTDYNDGCAHIKFYNMESCKAAVATMNGVMFMERCIKIIKCM